MLEPFSEMNGVDAALVCVLLLSTLLGALRGFVYEVMSLAGWLVAYAVAYLFSPRLLPMLPSEPVQAAQAVGVSVMPLLAFVMCFVGVLIAWNLLSHVIRLLVRSTPLSGIDRLFGSVFGLARGVLLLLALTVLVELTPWARAQAWQASTGVPHLRTTLAAVKPMLPPGVGRWLAR